MRVVAVMQDNRWVESELQRAAELLGVSVRVVRWSDLRAAVGLDGQSVALVENADAVLLWSMGAGSLEQIVFRMDLMQRLEVMGVVMVNPPRAIEIGVDKYLALALMQAAGLPVAATIVCQRYVDAMRAFDELGGDVVVKPLFGSQGFGMTRISDRAMAQRAFTQLENMQSVSYLQRFVPHDGFDYRLFVLGDCVVAAMRRRSDQWRTNIALGGKGEAVEPNKELVDLALAAAGACEAVVSGVDILIDREGDPYVLEVNPIPGWRHLSSVTGIDIACRLLGYVVRCAEEHHVRS